MAPNTPSAHKRAMYNPWNVPSKKTGAEKKLDFNNSEETKEDANGALKISELSPGKYRYNLLVLRGNRVPV